MKLKKIVVILVLGCIVYGCKPTLYMPASNDASQQQLLAGRKLYLDHCSSCHNLYFPNQFTAGQWQNNINEMQLRAKITDEEKGKILKYLLNHS